MKDQEEEWLRLCRAAVEEQDPNRLLDIVEQINRMLWEKEQRLKNQHLAQRRSA
jgi:hypothetical protein